MFVDECFLCVYLGVFVGVHVLVLVNKVCVFFFMCESIDENMIVEG